MLRTQSSPDLFFLQGCLIDLSPEASAFVSALLDGRFPAPAISVWHPHVPAVEGSSARLKFFNQAFLDLCDALSFKDDASCSIFPAFPLFLSDETAAAYKTSWEMLMNSIDSLHASKFQQTAHPFMHISLLGRQKTVLAELFAIKRDSVLLEYVIAETVLPDEAPCSIVCSQSMPLLPGCESPPCSPPVLSLSLPLPLPVSSTISLQPRRCNPHVFAWQLERKPSWELIDEEKRLKKGGRALRTGFCCEECGATETTQKRCAFLWEFTCVLTYLLVVGLPVRTRCATAAACGGRNRSTARRTPKPCAQCFVSIRF